MSVYPCQSSREPRPGPGRVGAFSQRGVFVHQNLPRNCRVSGEAEEHQGGTMSGPFFNVRSVRRVGWRGGLSIEACSGIQEITRCLSQWWKANGTDWKPNKSGLSAALNHRPNDVQTAGACDRGNRGIPARTPLVSFTEIQLDRTPFE